MTNRVLRFLEDRPYWIIYYVFYLAAIAGIALTLDPGGDADKWATVITLATGASIGGTIILEVIGMLLIRPTLQRIRQEIRNEVQTDLREEIRNQVQTETRNQVRQELQQAVERENLTPEQQKRIIDSIGKSEA